MEWSVSPMETLLRYILKLPKQLQRLRGLAPTNHLYLGKWYHRSFLGTPHVVFRKLSIASTVLSISARLHLF